MVLTLFEAFHVLLGIKVPFEPILFPKTIALGGFCSVNQSRLRLVRAVNGKTANANAFLTEVSGIGFDLIWVLSYMDSLNKTRSLFYIKVHEAKKALIKDIGPVSPFDSTGQRWKHLSLVYRVIV